MVTHSEEINGTLTLEDGFTIRYTSIGDSSKPLLLFVVGSSGLGSLYSRLAVELSSEFRCVRYDKRGFLPLGTGDEVVNNQRNPLVLVERHADDAATLLKHLSPTQPAFVFGTSTGGTAVLDLATRYPGLVSAAILHEPITFSVVNPAALREEMLSVYSKVGAISSPVEGFVVFAKYMFNAPGETRPTTFQAPVSNAVEVYNSRQALREAASMVEYTVDEQRAKVASDKIILLCGELSGDQRVSIPGKALASVFGDHKRLWKMPGGHLSFATKKYAPAFCEKLLQILVDARQGLAAGQLCKTRL